MRTMQSVRTNAVCGLLLFLLFTVIFLLISVTNANLAAKRCEEHLRCASADKDREYFRRQRLLPNWLEQCNCSDNCHQFGDCCDDSPQVINEDLNDWQMQVVNVNSGFRYFTLIKAKCPNDWKIRKVRDQCEKTGVTEAMEYLRSGLSNYLSLNEDEFLLWQVTSVRTLITYKNIYCALCNKDADQIESWSLNLKCIRDDLPGKCGQAFHPIPPSFLIKQKVRRKPVIQPQIFTGCNSVWTKANVRHNINRTIAMVKNCARIYAPVVYQDEDTQQRIIFKNKYCAICNDFDPNQLMCPSMSNDSYKLSFPFLFDTEANYDTDFNKGGLIFNTSQRCAKDHVYDPFREQCRYLLEEYSTSVGTRKMPIESTSTNVNVEKQSLLEDANRDQIQYKYSRASQRITSSQHLNHLAAFSLLFTLFFIK